VIKNCIFDKWQKFRRINNLVSTNHKGFFTITWVSICIVSQSIWVEIVQYFNNSIIKIHGNKYELTYVIKGKTYKMLVKVKKGPRNILFVLDENGVDVSHIMFPYLGPEENFHNQIYTPRFFNKKKLVFELYNGTEKTFEIDDNIIL
jgi:hypothetical protein